MGSCFSSDKVEPDNELEDKRKKTEHHSEEFILTNDKRGCTDVFFLILMILFLISLVVLIAYCAGNGDIYRIVNGYDNCANICGRVTASENDSRFPCKGANYTDKKFLLIKEAGKFVFSSANVDRSCRASCPQDGTYREFLNRCVPIQNRNYVNSFFSKTGLADFFQEVMEDMEMCWREIIYMCLIACAFSIILFILFRFFTGILVWVTLLGTIFVTVVATVFFWVQWKNAKNELKRENEQSEIDKRTVTAYMVYAIIATIIAVIVILVVLVMRKRISLVVQLFKEAGKALNSMPLLFLQPLVTFLTIIIFFGIWVIFSLLIESSGFLSKTGDNDKYFYAKNGTIKFTRWYNLLGLFWFIQFAIGCQHMVVAGAVSKWFFTRNKEHLNYPIYNSFFTLLRFHLGTVALGSFLIAIVQLIRSIFAYIENTFKDSENSVGKVILRCCHCCLWCFEKFLQYMSRNAYIITAIKGLSFCKAGAQAFKQLTANALRVAAINSVGDFVLFLGKALVVTATVLIGFEIIKAKEGVQHSWVPLSLAGIFAYLISHSFITIYEMAIDTIFLCFCEDCEQNDGITKHYYMSRGLMEFVENSKKALEVYDHSKRNWSGATTGSAK